MAHYDCKECHQDPVSGHAPDCARGKAMDEMIAGDAGLYEVPPSFESDPTAPIPANVIEQFARDLECGDFGNVNDALNSRMCCDGQMCGCRGSTVGEYLAYELRTASARIKGDKDRTTQSSAPNEVERLRTVLQYIADAAYVHHQGGNENFEYLQGIARDGLKAGDTPNA